MKRYPEIESRILRAALEFQKKHKRGPKMVELAAATGLCPGYICVNLDGLEQDGKLVCEKTERGNRKHGTMWFSSRRRARQ